MESKKFIDIDKVLKEKAYKLYRWLPRFTINWLKRTLHEKEINAAMEQLKNDKGLDFNRKALEILEAKVESVNPENIPLKGNVTVASNHPLGGLDGMALIKAVGELRPDVHFFVNDILKNLTNYGDVFVAVNKLGAASAGSLRTMEEIFRQGGAVLIFPAGLVSRKQEGVVRDLSWKKSFVTQAIDHKRIVVPTFIEGVNSNFFYNFAYWRKRLGIKANIEMLFLPDEMFSANKKTIRIHFGKPFSYEVFDSSKSHKAWADCIYKFIYSPEFMTGMPFEEFIKLTKKNN
ncbi:1-acyl-sn-glycerol-3-phosphate acyltransferase [Aurantibacillus circumpalustris]|uniref:1-acyl-sn-glycerol-3-phosphate acyltransferase n=1 Tax=Aurantibacillus circumpalustris TaxID=3036359 RepID=UPI00295B18EF|nr:1-acyl-sn-glycerol-3-phosphate acyltransferase [Aurantibacillus circumpalustris]